MTIALFADWRPTPVNFTKGDVTRPPHGLVLHIAQGTYEGTIGWERNPKAEVSSHFVVGPEGEIAQCVDLDDKAWTNGTGNHNWISAEFAGFVPQPLLADQVEAAATILAFLHTKYGVPLQITDDPNGRGLGWHGMGAAVGWGHPNCPGPAIVAQRQKIIARAQQLVTPTDLVRPDMHIVLGNNAIVSHLRTAEGAWLLLEDGGVLTFEGVFHGSASGKAYFKGKVAAKLVANPQHKKGDKKPPYVIETTSKQFYGYTGF